jgi:hypothetical protein
VIRHLKGEIGKIRKRPLLGSGSGYKYRSQFKNDVYLGFDIVPFVG